MPALRRPLPIFLDEAPSIDGHGEKLVAFLAPVNDPWIQTCLGEEKVIAEPDSRAACRITEGERYTNGRGGWVQGRRYLWTLDGQTVVGGLNVTLNKAPGRRKPDAVVSNIYVTPSHRRQGVASAMIARAQEDFPGLTVDYRMSLEGAALFLGMAPEASPTRETMPPVAPDELTDLTQVATTAAVGNAPRRRTLR